MIALTVGFGLLMAFVIVPQPGVSDAYADWLFGSAVVAGVDPYQTMDELGDRFGLEYNLDVAHPRPPGAVLPMAPLGLMTAENVRQLNNFLNVLAVVLVLWVSGGRLALPVGLLILSDPSFYQWANHIYWIGALVVLSLYTRAERLGGLLLGVAAALKLWPLALVAGLWSLRERQRARVALGVFVLLTVVGAFVANATIWRAVDTMGATSRLFVWSVSNGSPTSAVVKLGVPFPVAAIASVSLGMVWWLRHRTVEASIVLAFIASPLVWSGYQLIMAPFIAARVRSRELASIAVVVIFLVQGYPGWWRLLLTILMMLAIEIHPHRARRLRSNEFRSVVGPSDL